MADFSGCENCTFIGMEEVFPCQKLQLLFYWEEHKGENVVARVRRHDGFNRRVDMACCFCLGLMFLSACIAGALRGELQTFVLINLSSIRHSLFPTWHLLVSLQSFPLTIKTHTQ
jgi:hypothetical protein